MCGIIGYIGTQTASPKLIAGLESLEYRGYDSAGTAVLEDGKLLVNKHKGRVQTLKNSTLNMGLKANTGIGHTRWATHGKPSQENAHPHTNNDQSIAIVHNGIIENYPELRKSLIEQGCVFKSETDSEVIAHLIDSYVKQNMDLKQAVCKTVKQLHGSYAFVVISAKDPDMLIGTRKGSPLIVGKGENGCFFASDIPAIIKDCQDVCYPEDGQIIILNKTDIDILDKDQKPVTPEMVRITTSVDAASKNGFDHYMLKEIFEQPKVLQHFVHTRLDHDNNPFFEELEIPDSFFKQVERIFIVSCGTAYHAGYVGKYLLEEFTDIPVEIDISSEFRYRKMRLTPKSLMLCVSQSGETADTLACLREAKKKGCKILSICNVVNSSIARESHGVIYTDAGPEIGVASTKAYTAQLMTLSMLSLHIAGLRDQIDALSRRTLINELKTLPEKVEKIIEQKEKIKVIAEKYHKSNSSLYLGRGINYPTALEGALKNKEISYMHCEGYPAGEMKHGAIALINKDLPVVCVCSNGETYSKMLSNIREVEARDGIVICVCTENNEEIHKIASQILPVPETIEELSPIINIIPLQLFAYYTALAKGCDIDKPRNLAKSVTVE